MSRRVLWPVVRPEGRKLFFLDSRYGTISVRL